MSPGLRLLMGAGWIAGSILFLFVLEGVLPRLFAGYFIAAAIALQIVGPRLLLLAPFGLIGAAIGYLSTFILDVS